MNESPTLLIKLPAVLDTLHPIEFSDPLTGITVAMVERFQVQELPERWNKTQGFFILLAPLDNNSRWKAYVDTIKEGFRATLRNTDFSDLGVDKNFWSVAFLFTTDPADKPLSQEEIEYMKILMIQVFQTSPNVQVLNQPALIDNNFTGIDAEYMRHVLQSVLKVLFVRGYRNSHLGEISRNLTELYSPELIKDVPLLRKLQDWREQKAKLNNRPASTLVSNVELELISEVAPASIEELQAIEGLNTITRSYYAEEIISLINS